MNSSGSSHVKLWGADSRCGDTYNISDKVRSSERSVAIHVRKQDNALSNKQKKKRQQIQKRKKEKKKKRKKKITPLSFIHFKNILRVANITQGYHDDTTRLAGGCSVGICALFFFLLEKDKLNNKMHTSKNKYINKMFTCPGGTNRRWALKNDAPKWNTPRLKSHTNHNEFNKMFFFNLFKHTHFQPNNVRFFFLKIYLRWFLHDASAN